MKQNKKKLLKNIFYFGNEELGNEIIDKLKSLGGDNVENFNGMDVDSIYFIDKKTGNINSEPIYSPNFEKMYYSGKWYYRDIEIEHEIEEYENNL